MIFNLLEQPWLPIVRRSGLRTLVSPSAITSGITEDPILRLGAPRPDLNGALIQFLIGLVQTAMTPETPRDWRARIATPPTQEELTSAFKRYGHAFNLIGAGPRFMQDRDEELDGNLFDVGRLLIDSPGDQSVKRNIDHYVHRQPRRPFGLPATASALMCLQLNAPSGGQGHRVSLRGGGPLTTLVTSARSLWDLVWLNILHKEQLLDLGGSLDETDTSIFPWLSTSRTSENDEEVTPLDVSVLQAFWGMPRRIRLSVTSSEEGALCPIFHTQEKHLCSGFTMKAYGSSYGGNWRHPLTPYSTRKDGALNPIKTGVASPGYSDWLGLLFSEAESGGREPSRVVEALLGDRAKQEYSASRIWVFGYAVDNMKPLRWVDSEIPILFFEEDDRTQLSVSIRRLIKSASSVHQDLRAAIKSASLPDAKNFFNASWDPTCEFWSSTEAEFLDIVKGLSKLPNAWESSALRWIQYLSERAQRIFSDAVLSGENDFLNWQRSFVALSRLKMNTGPFSKKLRKILDLPVEPKTKPTRKKQTEGVAQR